MDYFKKRSRLKIIFISYLFITLLLLLFVVTMGPADITFTETTKFIVSKIPFLSSSVDLEGYPSSHETIILKVRLPRIILSALVGAALATVGGAFQGLFKNPMADPYIIGISAGASLGAAIGIAFKLSSILGFMAIPFTAFLGAFLSCMIVYNLGKVGTGIPVYTLLLAGVALSAFFSALTSFIIVIFSDETNQIVHWMMGGFSGSSWIDVKVAAPLILGGIFLLYLYSRELNAMLFGDDTAKYLGIDSEKAKKGILIIGSLTTAAAVSVSGTIGFVGLIIPHVVRIFVGPDHRVLLPFAAVTGAIFMALTDTAARVLFAPTEIPVGIITALFGGPFFIYLLRKKKSEFF